MLAVPIATSAFPALAHGEGTGRRQHGTLARSLQGILLLCGGAAAVLVAVARPVGTFFQALDRGASAGGGDALAAVPETLVAYAPGLVGFGAAALLTRALYVRGRPAQAALAVAGGWLVAALWPFITLPDDAGAAGTLRSLGAASLGRYDALGARPRPPGPPRLGRGGHTGRRAHPRCARGGRCRLGRGSATLLAFYWAPDRRWPALWPSRPWSSRAWSPSSTSPSCSLADRGAMQAALQRGRRRRGSDA